METMYFVLGMLTIVALAFVMVIVWGSLKITKQQNQIKLLQNLNEDNHRFIYEVKNSLSNRVDRDLEELNRVLSNDRREFGEEMRGISREFDRRFDDVWGGFRDLRNEMVELGKSEIDISKSYTDSRIDKLIDTYFDMVNVKKQIIK